MSKEKCVQLAKRTAALVEHIEKRANFPESEEIDNEINDNLQHLSRYDAVRLAPVQGFISDMCIGMYSLMEKIRRDVEHDVQRSWLYRFSHQAAIDSALDKRIQDLEDSWHAFDVRHLCTYKLSFSLTPGSEDGLPHRSE